MNVCAMLLLRIEPPLKMHVKQLAFKKTLLKHMKEGKVTKHTSSIKPYLTNENKKARLQWRVDMLEHESLHGNPRFKSLFYHAFIDKKWFFLLANLRGTTCFPTKMRLTALVRARTRSLSSCSCVSHVVQDLIMEFALLMGRLDVFLWLYLNVLRVVLTDQLE
jgi:hypothetical protein